MSKNAKRRIIMNVRTVAVLLLASVSCQPLHAQGLIKTMLEQIAKLEITLQEAKQGYNIAKKGLTIIGNIKKGDFDLHDNYFTSLSTVKGPIKNYAKVADIVRMQVAILDDCRNTIMKLSPTGVYTATQLAYCSRVFANLAAGTGQDMDELVGVLSDGHWQMTDDDRLDRIDAVYRRVAEKYNFCKSFGNQVRAIGHQHSLDLQSYSNLNKLLSK